MGMAMTIKDYLDDHHVSYDLIPHSYSYSSCETARVGHIPGDKLAKAIILEDTEGDYMMALLPATHRIDLGSLHREYHQQLGLATEKELGALFEDCEPGAIPAIGQAYGMSVMVDEALNEMDDIFFESGTHKDIVHIKGHNFRELMADAKHSSFSSHV